MVFSTSGVVLYRNYWIRCEYMDFEFPIVLNEYFSLDKEKSPDDILLCLNNISRTLVELSKHNSKVSFVRYNAIWKASSKNVEKAYNMVWEGEFKDSHLFLLALEDRNVQSEIASDCDYLLSDKLVRGFGVAVEHDFFCISAPNEPTSNIRLQGKKRELDKDGNLVETSESCNNLIDASEKSIDLMNGTFLSGVEKASHLWEKRESLFPYLRFLSRVEDDLNDLPDACFDQVFRKLRELNWSAKNWD